MRLTAVYVLLVAATACGQFLLNLPLTGGLQPLRDSGWQVPNQGVVAQTDSLKMTSQSRCFIKLDLPVKSGNMYRGSLMARSLDVEETKQGDRGATVFFGFLDAQKNWVVGGEFPAGPMGDSEWTKINIESTRMIPEGVAFVQVWIGIEGKGNALFRDFEMTEFDLKSLKSDIDTSSNPPTVTVSQIPWLEAKLKRHNRLRVLVSKNPDMPPEDTFEFIGAPPSLTLPHALAAGTWYARAMRCDNVGEYQLALTKFTLPEPAIGSRRLVKPLFPNGHYSPQAMLTVSFHPPLEVEKPLHIIIDGRSVTMVERTADQARFQAAMPLPPGHWPVKVTAEDQVYTLYYVNKEPANKITRRDDLLLLVNGQPFFPIGTYRDPSDDLWEFAGICEAGFNVTHSYHFEDRQWTVEEARRYLRLCEENGVMTFLGLNRAQMRLGDWQEIAFRCGELYDEPGLLTWYLADEPTGWIDKFSFAAVSKTVQETAPGIPRTLLMCQCITTSPLNQFYGNKLSDIYWFDSYPAGRSPLIKVKKDMLASRQIASPEQPLWAVIQAFDWRNHKVKELNLQPEDMEPKAGKIRCMTHLALTADVQGIIFYWLPKSRYDYRMKSPIQWEEVKATTRELHGLMPFLIGRVEKLPDDAIPAPPCEYWQRRAADGRRVLVLVNPEERTIDVKLDTADLKRQITLMPHGVEIIVY